MDYLGRAPEPRQETQTRSMICGAKSQEAYRRDVACNVSLAIHPECCRQRRSKLRLYNFALRTLLSANMHHGPRRGHEIRLADVVPFFFLLHHAVNKFR